MNTLLKSTRFFIPVFAIAMLFYQMVFAQPTELDPKSLTKYVDPLPIPGIMQPVSPNYYEIGMYQKMQQLHSQLPPTTIWGYGTSESTAGYPAATIEVTRGVPIQVKWTNNLTNIIHPMPVDQTLHWADPLNTGHSHEPYTGPVPAVVHVHGAEVEPASDGNPDSWFTPGFAIKGPGWIKEVYEYTNEQPATTLWYHDHALGITRLNVYMGLAGYYIIRDPGNEPVGLPSGDYEIPLVIQDKSFNTDGSLNYPGDGVNPMIHPFWIPEFFGNTILVNGKVWPYLDVEPRKYRFRILNGSNARFYRMRLSSGTAIVQIGTDGGYLSQPVMMDELILAPGERADVIIDFSGLPVGRKITMLNNAKSPYPNGETTDPRTVGQIMQFRVVPLSTPDNSIVPSSLNTITPLLNPVVTRTLTLNEAMGMDGPIAAFLDGKMWDAEVTEIPNAGDTELWEIVNLTGDAHPIHLHLVQFQLLNRQKFNVKKYMDEYEELNPEIPAEETINPEVEPYLQGNPKSPEANETGWKDTYKAYPGEVTRFLIRFAPIGSAEVTPFPFDASAEPGYVWHCHILEHEDNEMMRPMRINTELINKEATLVSAKTPVLHQNHPNPFNPVTNINYEIPVAGKVSMKVYDVLGREVMVLVEEFMDKGIYQVSMNAQSLPSGVYYYSLNVVSGGSESFNTETKRMILIK